MTSAAVVQTMPDSGAVASDRESVAVPLAQVLALPRLPSLGGLRTHAFITALALWRGHLFVSRWLVASAVTFTVDYYQAILRAPDTFVSRAWSLAVQEQFYALWPAAFLLLMRRGSRAVVWALAMCASGVLLLALDRVPVRPGRQGLRLPRTRHAGGRARSGIPGRRRRPARRSVARGRVPGVPRIAAAVHASRPRLVARRRGPLPYPSASRSTRRSWRCS